MIPTLTKAINDLAGEALGKLSPSNGSVLFVHGVPPQVPLPVAGARML
jgi:hypothetical protein